MTANSQIEELNQNPGTFLRKQWFYTKRPEGLVGPEHYQLIQSNFAPVLSQNEVLIEAQYISVDPYMRIQQHAKANWEAPHPLNSVQGAAVVSKVLTSNHSEFAKGDWVVSYSGWQTHAVCHGSELEKLNPETAPVTSALGVLGMPGRTAWFGLMEAGKPKPGDVVVVSGAAGAVGSLVVQFAIKAGCQVIGIVGSEEKKEWLLALGAKAAINYKNHSDASSIQKELLSLVPAVDVYFDNVGGIITDAVLDSLNLRARVIICGQISQYGGGLDNPELGPRFLHQMLYKRATIQGILARDFSHRMAEMKSIVGPWLKDNEIDFKTTMTEGFESLPSTLRSLFNGANIGKAIVKV